MYMGSGIFRLCSRLIVGLLGFGQHSNLMYCVFTWFLDDFLIPSQGGLNISSDLSCYEQALKSTQHLGKAFDYSADIFNLHMVVSTTYGYMGSRGKKQSLKPVSTA